ncbi:hypothetical protein EON62_04860 [archaeon]|nr:MAG: hypothetical protein EON62_04860 [archaeon]
MVMAPATPVPNMGSMPVFPTITLHATTTDRRRPSIVYLQTPGMGGGYPTSTSSAAYSAASARGTPLAQSQRTDIAHASSVRYGAVSSGGLARVVGSSNVLLVAEADISLPSSAADGVSVGIPAPHTSGTYICW